MNISAPTLDTVLETEEFVTAEEYLRRRERGEIAPSDVRIVAPSMDTGNLGGFMVKLKTPRYRVQKNFRNRMTYGW